MASKWVSGTYLGSISVNKVELKYTLELKFSRERRPRTQNIYYGQVTGEGLYDEKPFTGTGKSSETAPFTFKTTLHEAFGFKAIFLDGFRGQDDTIFGQWMEVAQTTPKKPRAAEKPKRPRFNRMPGADNSSSDEEGEGEKEGAPAPAPGGGRGNFFLKYKKLSPEELEARRKQEAAEVAKRKEKELSEPLSALQAMGFSKENSLQALMQNDGNVDRALDALFASGGDLSQGGSQGTAPAAAPATPAINEALVSQLIDMGFTRDRAIHALEATNNNVEHAVELLFSS